MCPAIEALISEMNEEAAATRRLLDQIPADRLEWRPDSGSLSLGELAHQTATIPGAIVELLSSDGIDMSEVRFEARQVRPASEISIALEESALEESLAAARAWLSGLDERAANAMWRAHRAGKELFSAPRLSLLRSLMLNHWYHHRAQLTAYLRQLEVPLPWIYGPAASEGLFAY